MALLFFWAQIWLDPQYKYLLFLFHTLFYFQKRHRADDAVNNRKVLGKYSLDEFLDKISPGTA